MLKQRLEALRKGELVLYERDYLFFSAGRYSGALGLGNCGCQSHPPRVRVTRKDVLVALRALVARSVQDQRERDTEVAWLDQAISGLG